MAIFLKDPAAVVDYAVDWAGGYLGSLTITSSQWRVTPAGLGVSGAAIDAQRTVVTLAAGVAGTVYRVVNAITMSDGRSDERTLVIRVEDR